MMLKENENVRSILVNAISASIIESPPALNLITAIIICACRFADYFGVQHMSACPLHPMLRSVLALRNNNTGSFYSPRIDIDTHAACMSKKLLTVLSGAASLSLKPLKCGSSSSSPSAVLVKPTPPPPLPLHLHVCCSS